MHVSRISMTEVPILNALDRKNTTKKFKNKNQLTDTENKGRNADENIYRLLRHKKHVLRRIVNAPHLAADADNVHGEEHAIDTDECQPKVDSAECFIHQTAEHFRKPEIQPAECREEWSNRHHQVKMRHDEVRILKLDICGRGSKKNSAQPAAHK